MRVFRLEFGQPPSMRTRWLGPYTAKWLTAEAEEIATCLGGRAPPHQTSPVEHSTTGHFDVREPLPLRLRQQERARRLVRRLFRTFTRAGRPRRSIRGARGGDR